MEPKKILILGNGGAACHGIMAARSAGFSGSIEQVSDIDEPAFNPMLSPYFLKGIIPWDNCFPFGKDFYGRHQVTRHFGSPVTALDAEARTARLEDGRVLEYDRCLVATGASCVLPPVPGLRESSRVLSLRSAECTRRLHQAASSVKRAVVIGASLVGIKVAEILRRRGKDVTLIDLADQVLPHSAHPLVAAILKEYFEEHGMEVRLGLMLQGVHEDMDGIELRFPGDYRAKGEFCAACTGIRPNLGFLDRDQVEIDRAILVDDTMQTTAPGLYAAGDVCQGTNLLTGQREWLGLWGNACYQGRTAGINMAGGRATYPGTVPAHVSPFFDWTMAQVGDVNGKGDDVRIMTGGDPRKGMYHLLVFEGHRLAGVNLINGFKAVGMLKTAIVRRLDWSDFLAAHDQPDFAEVERFLIPRLKY